MFAGVVTVVSSRARLGRNWLILLITAADDAIRWGTHHGVHRARSGTTRTGGSSDWRTWSTGVSKFSDGELLISSSHGRSFQSSSTSKPRSCPSQPNAERHGTSKRRRCERHTHRTHAQATGRQLSRYPAAAAAAQAGTSHANCTKGFTGCRLASRRARLPCA